MVENDGERSIRSSSTELKFIGMLVPDLLLSERWI